MFCFSAAMDRRRLFSLAALTALVPAIARASESKGEGGKKRSGGANYLVMQTLLGTTIRSDGRRGVMSVECGLDVPDAGLRALAEQSIPRLRSSYVETVQSYARGLPNGAAPNADFIARTLQRQTDAILGRPGARLLLGAILVN
jgi:hypothetical protein